MVALRAPSHWRPAVLRRRVINAGSRTVTIPDLGCQYWHSCRQHAIVTAGGAGWFRKFPGPLPGHGTKEKNVGESPQRPIKDRAANSSIVAAALRLRLSSWHFLPSST